MNNQAATSNDKELWRDKPGDYYADSIHVTEGGGIGINCGGHVIVAPLRMWHDAGNKILAVNLKLPDWRKNLAYKLLGWKKS